MKISQIEQILFVTDLVRSRNFYGSLFGLDPVTEAPGMVEFSLASNFKLGLMPLEGISKILGHELIQPELINLPPRGELYLEVDNLEESFSKALSLGATLLSPITERNWGHRAGYLADPDGHVFALAEKIS